MQNHPSDATLFGFGLLAVACVAVFALALYLFGCHCLKRICEKCGKQPGILIWIPILHIFPLLEAAGMAAWQFVLFFIPIVNFVVGIILWANICKARGKSSLLVLLLIVPGLNVFGLIYLAYSE